MAGGGGGEGTVGGHVVHYNQGSHIETRGAVSAGIVAQSIGGGGGDVMGNGGALSVITVGGQGGPGGEGGPVELYALNGSQTRTHGSFSYGVLAQSIGGGGGNGGDVFGIDARLPTVAVGGAGASGGKGGTVTYEAYGTGAGPRHLISTGGSNSHGLLLQSVGGGGGAGGDAQSLSIGLGGFESVAIAGGAGGGGAGDEVSAILADTDIRTEGSHARGIVAHSVGGGGGAGGAAISRDVSFGVATSIALGGVGGDGGDGGLVSVDLTRVTVATGGDTLQDLEEGEGFVANNHGVVVQSIGRGGGLGGSGDALAYAMDLPIEDLAQIAIAGSLALGGEGGQGGDGGEVSVSLTDSTVTTRGDGGHGILMHSVGGSGGDGGDGTSRAASALLLDKAKSLFEEEEEEEPGGGDNPGEGEDDGEPMISSSVAVALGGDGGGSGVGGKVSLVLDGASLVETFGPHSNAILAQSIGNGGGNAGIASAGVRQFGEGDGVFTNIAIGASGADAAKQGGDMEISLGAQTVLRTHARVSRGLVMHSVGGGGGASQSTFVGMPGTLADEAGDLIAGIQAPWINLGMGMTGGAGGKGGNIGHLDLSGGIETFGADSDGVLAQTIGGGGGAGGGFGGGDGDDDTGGPLINLGLTLNELKEQIERPWSATIIVGGTGGKGGEGGDYATSLTETSSFRIPTLDGTVITHGDYADGVVLQSIGGGGGAGGAAVPEDSIGLLDFSLRLGGTGGDGGAGGAVGFRLSKDGQLSTSGFGSHGVLLQSIGGGGGQGGSASRLIAKLDLDDGSETGETPGFVKQDLDKVLGDGEDPLAPALVRLGVGASGPGGTGGTGGRAEANGEGGLIHTSGTAAFGLTVQSVGGGGGMGGIGNAPLTAAELELQAIDPDDRQVFVDTFNALFRGAHLDFIAGGDGGRGGDGGDAAALGDFRIVTEGDRAPALLVQSVGGGGGAAGLEGARLLRSGAEGAVGDSLYATARLGEGTAIDTSGLSSHGVVVQSVAGGGGTTMSTLAYGTALRRYDVDAPPSKLLDLMFELRLGAQNKTSAKASSGVATLELEGTIATHGDGAYGAIVQSVAGGGGVVGLTPAEIDRRTTTTVSSGEVVMGTTADCGTGDTCAGSDNVSVDIARDAVITTEGVGARGLVAQSIQSGGGVASGFEELQRASAGETKDVTRSISVIGSHVFRRPGPQASELSFAGAIQTLGADADGLVFQHIGGGGGVMGSAGGQSYVRDETGRIVEQAPLKLVADDTRYRMDISLGQTNAAGGPQNAPMSADLGGTILTYGDHAEAAIVQSISSGGGIAGLYQDPTSTSQALGSIRVGADGVTQSGPYVDQGATGRLTATLSQANYGTYGYAAAGVVLQQIQGGGGIAASGSNAFDLRAGETDDGWERVGLTVGGNYGGANGSGPMTVTLTDDVRIFTGGEAASALVVQNIVGGGGIGAVGSQTVFNGSAPPASTVDVRVGGGNDTGVNNSINYYEEIYHAEVGALDMTIEDAWISTVSDGAHAALVQSVGGGGGLAVAPSGALTDVALGSSGGGSSWGGRITLDVGLDPAQTTLLQTLNMGARALAVQSITGGGGALAAHSTELPWQTGARDVQLGATGETYGAGAPVKVRFGGQAVTLGAYSDALLVQSIGGGGGMADIDGAQGGRVPDFHVALGQSAGSGVPAEATLRLSGAGENRGFIETAGEGAYGVLAQVIGGGGGVVSIDARSDYAELALGSASSEGSRSAADLTLRMDTRSLKPFEGTAIGYVKTKGHNAHAIVGQSIGGGGGVARAAAPADGGGSHLILGGKGGEADGGYVDIVYASRFVTEGRRSIGIVAQSIGGGGGIALSGEGSDVASMRLGGATNFVGQSRSREASVYLYPNPQHPCGDTPCGLTVGEGAHAIVVQSIGGGGGILGDVSLADGIRLIDYDPNDAGEFERAYGGFQGAGAADGADVFVGFDVATLGAGAYGVIAQSIAGGGGLAGGPDGAFAGKTGTENAVNKARGAEVAVAEGVSLQAVGENSAAIFAQSLGDDISTQSIYVGIRGDVLGGTGEFGLGLLAHGGGAENELKITSTGSLASLEGQAVRYVGATNDQNSILKISNRGALLGSVEAMYRDGEVYLNQGAASEISAAAAPAATGRLSRPAARLVNEAGGVAAGARVYQADVVNRGLLVAGDAGRFAPLDIAGHLIQSDGGTLAVDADPIHGRGDVLQVAGDARLDGALQVSARALIGGVEHRLIEAGGEVQGRFDEAGGAIFRFDQIVEDGGLTLRASGVELSGPGVSGQEAAAARYLERLFMSGDVSFARFFGRLEAAAAGGALAPALSGVTLGASMAGEAATFELARDRFDALLDCGATGGRSVSAGGACLTLLGSGRDLSQDGDGEAGYDGQAWTAGFSGTLEVAPGWLVSGVLGWETLNLREQGGGSSVDGTTGFVGAGVTREMGPLALSAAATAGWSEFDASRAQGLLAPGAAESEHGALSLGARVRAAWTRQLSGGWLRPSLDLDLIHVAAEGYAESGAGRSSLRVADSEATAFVVTPSLEAGLARDLGDDLGLRAWARAGVSLSTLDSYDATARFAVDATGTPGFVNGVAQSQAVGRIGLGASLQAGERVDVGVSYEGAFADGYTGHAGRASVTVRF
ncbi:MAG: autotransporter outer membrane beta-barrel domain-containing protein [Albimonas sp.]|uniref:autotransporter outer membrane beta-barrel domain-containing protein n=1 Tax=Albimonas sp. TaxID=1872425 RepID=UPI0040562FA4